MAENCEIYVSNQELLSNARIRNAVDGARVQFDAQDGGHTEHANWVGFKVRWPEGVVHADRLDIRHPVLPERLQARCDWVTESAGGAVEHANTVADLHAKILKTRSLLALSGPPECADRIAAFARYFASESNDLLFLDGSLFDPRGRLCMDGDGQSDASAMWATLPSATHRKAHSAHRLQAGGVPVLEDLPPIEATEESFIRPPWEVARRACALVTVAARAEGMEQQKAIQYLQAWGLWEAASPWEQAFLLSPQPAETDRIQALWRYECLWVMLWALGHVERLELPTGICDVRRAMKMVTGVGADVFIGGSNLRANEDILDEADFIYRCHSAIDEAARRGEAPPAGLDRSVVIERHVALNWLTCHHSQAWDNVSPDM